MKVRELDKFKAPGPPIVPSQSLGRRPLNLAGIEAVGGPGALINLGSQNLWGVV